MTFSDQTPQERGYPNHLAVVRHTCNHVGLKKNAFHTHRAQHPGVVHDARRYPHASLGWHDPRPYRCRNDQSSRGAGDELALSVLMGGHNGPIRIVIANREYRASWRVDGINRNISDHGRLS